MDSESESTRQERSRRERQGSAPVPCERDMSGRRMGKKVRTRAYLHVTWSAARHEGPGRRARRPAHLDARSKRLAMPCPSGTKRDAPRGKIERRAHATAWCGAIKLDGRPRQGPQGPNSKLVRAVGTQKQTRISQRPEDWTMRRRRRPASRASPPDILRPIGRMIIGWPVAFVRLDDEGFQGASYQSGSKQRRAHAGPSPDVRVRTRTVAPLTWRRTAHSGERRKATRAGIHLPQHRQDTGNPRPHRPTEASPRPSVRLHPGPPRSRRSLPCLERHGVREGRERVSLTGTSNSSKAATPPRRKPGRRVARLGTSSVDPMEVVRGKPSPGARETVERAR